MQSDKCYLTEYLMNKLNIDNEKILNNIRQLRKNN